MKRTLNKVVSKALFIAMLIATFFTEGMTVSAVTTSINILKAVEDQYITAGIVSDTTKYSSLVSNSIVGTVVELTGDCVLSEEMINVTTGQVITLDLNGFTIKRSIDSDNDEGQAVIIVSDGVLNIVDTSDTGRGSIYNAYNATPYGSGIIQNGGTVNFYSGTILASGQAFNLHNGTFNMYGGKLIGIKVGDIPQSEALTTDGGRFNIYAGYLAGFYDFWRGGSATGNLQGGYYSDESVLETATVDTGYTFAALSSPVTISTIQGEYTLSKWVYMADLSGISLEIPATSHLAEQLTAKFMNDSTEKFLTASYTWQRSSDGSSWSDITGATNKHYTVGSMDEGKKLRVVAKIGEEPLTSDPSTVYVYPQQLVNGSFEYPTISSSNQWVYHTILPEEQAAFGWNKTVLTSYFFEFGGDFGDVGEWGIKFVPEGSQFIELNADEQSAIYQDVSTTPGTILYWSLYQGGVYYDRVDGRNIDNTMAVRIGSPAELNTRDTMISINQTAYDQSWTSRTIHNIDNKTVVSSIPIAYNGKDDNKKRLYTEPKRWTKYEGFYEVPAGQTITRFVFASLSTDPLQGNLLDGVVFRVATEVELAKIRAKGELTIALVSYTESNYSPANWTALNNAKTAGDTAIEAATDIDGVTSAKVAAITAMAAVQTLETELATAKITAKEVLTNALRTYTQSNYSAYNWTALNNAKTAGDTAIDAAADLGGVTLAKTTALDAMAAVRTLAVGPIYIPTPPSTTVKETLYIGITDGKLSNVISETKIERTTEPDGTKKDVVTYEGIKAKDTVDKLKELGQDTARISIPDTKDEVRESRIDIPQATLDILGNGKINLEIETENVRINIPKESIQDLSEKTGEDLYFKIVPIKNKKEKEEIRDRAKQNAAVLSVTTKNGVSVIGRPMEIETNMSGRNVDIVLPLKNIEIPTNPKEREAYLSSLGIFIEHSDGEKVLIKGEVVDLGNGLLGIKFRINKFSTFTILKLDEDLAAAESKPAGKVFLVATNLSYADAYAGEVLAKKMGAQIITVGTKDKDVQSFIKNVEKSYTKNDQIYILGGKLAAPINLEKQLKAKGYSNITRIGGVDLYETAKKISEKIAPKKGTPVILVNDSTLKDYSDSVSKAAAKKGYVILYVKKNSLTRYTLSALLKIEPSKVYIAGTSNSVSKKVILELQNKLDLQAQSIVRIKSTKDIK